MVEGMFPVRLLLFNNLAQHCSCYFHDLENDKSLNKHNDHDVWIVEDHLQV